MWESSRMMLPEHVEALINHDIEQKKRERIYLDDQELEYISGALQGSLRQRIMITVKLYDPFEQLLVTGIVERIDRSIGV